MLYGHCERVLSADGSTWGKGALDQSKLIQISNKVANKREMRDWGKTDLN